MLKTLEDEYGNRHQKDIAVKMANEWERRIGTETVHQSSPTTVVNSSRGTSQARNEVHLTKAGVKPASELKKVGSKAVKEGHLRKVGSKNVKEGDLRKVGSKVVKEGDLRNVNSKTSSSDQLRRKNTREIVQGML